MYLHHSPNDYAALLQGSKKGVHQSHWHSKSITAISCSLVYRHRMPLPAVKMRAFRNLSFPELWLYLIISNSDRN